MESTPPWLREALRFALTATASTPAPWSQHESDNSKAASGGDLVDPNDPGKDPRFRKLVEAILYGRRLLNTYNLVLVGVLLFFTLWHWAEKLVLHQRIRKAAATRTSNSETASAEDAEAWSSSSSTVGGSVTPPDAVPVKNASSADESSPLLPSRRLQPKSVGIWRPYYLLKAALQYQPPQIPFIHKTLPTNAVSLLVLAWIGLIIFYNFYRMPLEFKYLFVFGDRCGLVFVTNLPLLYLLAAKNQPIKFLTGYSYESLNIFHRRVGEVMCLEAFVHFLGMILTWYGMLRHLGFTLAKFLFNRVVLLGLAAFIAYELIYFTSLGSFRQRWYEIFLALHVVLQFAGLVFLWFHHSTSRPYVAISLGIWLIDRVVYRLWLKSSTHPATLTVLEDEETILVSANWEVSSQKSALAPKNMNQGWKPNEHIFLTVPALSRKHTLQSHPFTIFSAAPTVSEDNSRANHAWFTLLIRAQAKSGFTHTLLEHARTTPRTRIRLDGPYGSSHALDMLEASSTAVLIAGGSGIAVAYPLLYALLCPSSTDPEAAAIRTKRKVKLLWITHAPAHRLWIPDDKLEELENWGLDVLIPPPTSLAGRPNAGYILREWVGQGTDRDGGRAGVVVSGPDGLVRDVRNTCASLIWGGRDVDVQVEKFGW